jgi:hypothetical protein
MSATTMTQEEFTAHSIAAAQASATEGARILAQAARDAAAAAALEPAKPVTPSFQQTVASVARLVDTDMIANARTAYEQVCNRQTVVAQQVGQAEQGLLAAEAQMNVLATAAAKGEAVTAQTSAAAGQAVRDAEAHLMFLRTTSTQLHSVVLAAHDDLMLAQRQAYVPVLEHGADLRIAAAINLDVARATLAEAQRDWDIACDVVDHARQQGVKMPQAILQKGLTREHHSEALERAIWDRPVSA